MSDQPQGMPPAHETSDEQAERLRKSQQDEIRESDIGSSDRLADGEVEDGETLPGDSK